MTDLITYIPLILIGAGTTIAAWLIAGTMSILVGTFLGIIGSSHVSSNKIISCVRIYTFITKGVPAYVQILIFYFVIPRLLGLNIPGFVAASSALAICSSGYVTEIIRAGINSIPNGQWDASFVLGYNLPQTIMRIIFPQALRITLSALIGELEQLLKSTSLLATIGVTEVTRVGMNIISRELNPLPVYLMIAVIYLLLSAILNIIMIYTERKTKYGYY